MAKDYFNHEINIGDVVLYNERGSRGYCSTFSEGIVIQIGNQKLENGRITIVPEENLDCYKCDDGTISRYRTDCKYSTNVVNLTALDVRENQAYKIGE